MTAEAASGLVAGVSNTTGDGKIPPSDLLQVLRGVIVATKTPDDSADPVVQWITARKISHSGNFSSSDTNCQNVKNEGHKEHDEHGEHDEREPNNHEDMASALSLNDWLTAIGSDLQEELPKQLARLALGVAFLRGKSRASSAVTPTDLALVWSLIYGVLTCSSLDRPLCSASRSAQGFLAVPLCSLLKDGNIDELFRLHVWLPDGQRGNMETPIHSHQPFAQSWILAGEGKDCSYKVEPVGTTADATHAEYALAWNDGTKLDKAYKTHQTSSTLAKTEKLVRATATNSAVHTRNMSYSIPSAAYHTSEVAPNSLHATLFFFDSHRGFVKDAGVLGPVDKESFTQQRDPAGVTPAALAGLVDAIRSWETFMEYGRQHARRADWEHALREFNSAYQLCDSIEKFPNATLYRRLVLGELGNTNRRFGRYNQAKVFLEKAIEGMEPDQHQIDFSGELGVVYRHLNLIEDAKRAFEIQYHAAKQLGFEKASCRAVGNLGMVNFQLSQQNHDNALLELAIEQLNERVRTARQVKNKTWEAIGLARLSICYAAHGNLKDAISSALESLNITATSEDSTVIAMSHFFYGRALWLDGQHDEALKHFNLKNTCTPAIALCKEPSEEHFQYLRELVNAGADMNLPDEHGYTALDYAVFNGDSATEQLVLEGIRQQLDTDVDRQLAERYTESKLRKGYRELFQEKLRPVLLSDRGSRDALHKLRRVYAKALAADEETRRTFDGFKFIRYPDFLRFGKLPRSTDNLTQQFMSKSGEDRSGQGGEFVIFFSYRWIGDGKPDDENHTQYRRMIEAAEEFLRLHPDVDREKLCIWMDFACVNQEDPGSGVAALPMNLAQCNAVISLVNESYYTRAWCSVEVMMVQTLKKSYNLHLWYEHAQDKSRGVSGEDHKQTLRDGPMDMEIVMAEKNLSLEIDRPKVMFLERQTQFLG